MGVNRGAAGGVVAYGIVYPLNTISTILQVQAKKKAEESTLQYQGTWDTVAKVSEQDYFRCQERSVSWLINSAESDALPMIWSLGDLESLLEIVY